jgi:hypothetical protein
MYDGQREKSINDVGWAPYAFALGFNQASTPTTVLTLPAYSNPNYGVVACPIDVQGHMLLQSVSIRNLNTSTARSWSWSLYEQYLNNGNAGENTLARVAVSNAADAWTPGAAGTRTSVASGAPVYLAPGIYWLTIVNDHATSTFDLGTVASGALAQNMAQTKPIPVPGATLDFVAATWTKITGIVGARLDGRVFGGAAAF